MSQAVAKPVHPVLSCCETSASCLTLTRPNLNNYSLEAEGFVPSFVHGRVTSKCLFAIPPGYITKTLNHPLVQAKKECPARHPVNLRDFAGSGPGSHALEKSLGLGADAFQLDLD